MFMQYETETLDKLHRVEVNALKDIATVCEANGIGYWAVFGTLIGAIRHHGFIPWDDDMDIAMFRDDYDKFVAVFDKQLGEKYDLMTPLREKGYASAVTRVEIKGTRFVPEMLRKSTCKQGIFIDIFVYDKVSNDPHQYRKQVKKARLLSMLLFLIGSPHPVIQIGGFKEKVAKGICRIAHYTLKLFPWLRCSIYKSFIQNAMKANDASGENYTIFQSVNPDRCIVNQADVLPLTKVPFDGIEISVPKNYDSILRHVYGDYMQLPAESERVNHRPIELDFGPYQD